MSWMENCYSRLLIDNHITDLDPSFMRSFDPEQYVAMVKKSGVDSAMVYACCHNGNCYYPTRVGQAHGNLQGRDLFGAVVGGLRAARIVPVGYYTVIYHNHSALSHAEWQVRDPRGKASEGRYRLSCPNHPGYVAFTKAQLEEIIAYPIDGLFIDMTFWPGVCCCESCRARFRAEAGQEIPTMIDWGDPKWVVFQRHREKWMAGFAQDLTDHLQSIRPELSVTHQFSPVLHGWQLGQSTGIARASDYASGDFYGDKYQQRFGAKVFEGYTRQPPYEFMTSRCVNLHDHTSTKSDEELFLHAATTLANGGAYFFIDAINPDGTLNPRFYERLGKVVQQLKPFKDCIQKYQSKIQAACGLYFSMISCGNAELSGRSLADFCEAGGNMSARPNPVVDEAVGTGIVFNKMKTPYRVLTEMFPECEGLNTLVINNAAYLSQPEVERLRRFVATGGTLVATGLTSYYDAEGKTSGDFQLADVFGVSFSGTYSDKISYLSVAEAEFPEGLISSTGKAPLVRATTAKVLGEVVNPHFPAGDPLRYASIHSNPPGLATGHPGLTINTYGKGRCIYLYSSLLGLRQDSQQQFAQALFSGWTAPASVRVLQAPACVEVTLLEGRAQPGLVLCLVNYQDELPCIPALGIRVELTLPGGAEGLRLRQVSDGRALAFTRTADGIAFTVERLEQVEMVEICRAGQ